MEGAGKEHFRLWPLMISRFVDILYVPNSHSKSGERLRGDCPTTTKQRTMPVFDERFGNHTDVTRIDLHLHSIASGNATNWWVKSLGFGMETRESYTQPQKAYDLATSAGMDFVTLTDHETITGAATLTHHGNFLVGEEVGTQFPEDGSKADILVYGLTAADHAELQSRRGSIYDVVEYLREANLVHVLAHPLFEVGAPLTRECVEKRMALFPLWEFINGSRPRQQNHLTQRIAELVNASDLRQLAARHGLPAPLHTRIAGTAGSDDHGGVYPGSTWTELPRCTSVSDVLEAMRAQEVRPGGTHGSVQKMTSTAFRIIANAAQEGLVDSHSAPEEDSALPIQRLMPGRKAQVKKVLEYLPLLNALDGEQIRGLLTAKYESQLSMSLGDTSGGMPVLTLLSSLGSLVDAHLAIAPYVGVHNYFGRERAKTRAIQPRLIGDVNDPIHVGVFVDDLHEVHGVSTMYKQLHRVQSTNAESRMTLVQCGGTPTEAAVCLRAVTQLGLPLYEGRRLGVPSVLDVLDHVSEQDYDVLHIATPGPLGLAAMVAGLTLGIPIVGAYHTEFGSYARILSGDSMVAEMVDSIVREFYERCNTILVPSQSTAASLPERGFRVKDIQVLKNGVDTALFSPDLRDENIRAELGRGKNVLMYAGRVSREKGLDEFAQAYLAANRNDIHLVVAGDGPYRAEMEQLLGDSATFTGFLHGEDLARVYASADVFVFPSTTDTLGRVVSEAQASGVPAVVFGIGGPREAMRGGETGFVVESGDMQRFIERALWLADHDVARSEMGKAAARFATTLDWHQVYLDLMDVFRRVNQNAIENTALSVAM